jgi:hypothetical protein
LHQQQKGTAMNAKVAGDEWDGKDRRACPTFDEKNPGSLVQVILHFNRRFDDHTSDEMERYEEILTLIRDNNEASNARHERIAGRVQSLIDSFNSFMEKAESHDTPCTALKEVHGAFLKDEDDENKIDYPGHKRDHKARKYDAEENRKLRGKVLLAVVSALAIAVGAWVWQALKLAAVAEIQAAAAKEQMEKKGH